MHNASGYGPSPGQVKKTLSVKARAGGAKSSGAIAKRSPSASHTRPTQTMRPLAGRAIQPQAVDTPRKTFPIVGIGASAGGLTAFTQLLRSLPPDTGMAFVL